MKGEYSKFKILVHVNEIFSQTKVVLLLSKSHISLRSHSQWYRSYIRTVEIK